MRISIHAEWKCCVVVLGPHPICLASWRRFRRIVHLSARGQINSKCQKALVEARLWLAEGSPLLFHFIFLTKQQTLCWLCLIRGEIHAHCKSVFGEMRRIPPGNKQTLLIFLKLHELFDIREAISTQSEHRWLRKVTFRAQNPMHLTLTWLS